MSAARTIKIGIFGCGTIGTGLLSLLAEKEATLRERLGVEFRVAFAAGRSKGTLVSREGAPASEIFRALSRGERIGPVRAAQPTVDELLDEAPAEIICDMTPTDYATGEPSLSMLRAAFARGVSAVTCSKGGLAKGLLDLKELAEKCGAKLRFESSVMSGTPVMSLARGPMAGCDISSVRGILNGTTNFMLTRMEHGMEYEDALAEASRLGYAEPDPSGDVDGWDAAVKTCILAAELFGARISVDEVDRQGIREITRADVEAAAAQRRRVKLIASVVRTADGARASVRPEELDVTAPLAGVDGVSNGLAFETDSLGEVTIFGPGAGAKATAQGILADLLSIADIQDMKR